MKILHTSDWHLGMSFGIKSLIEDQKYFIDELIECIKKEDIKAVVISGDVYDSSVSNSDAIKLYNYAVTSICGDLNIPTFIIAGNHDGAARLAACNQLLKSSGLYVTGNLDISGNPVVIDDVVFYSLPYFVADEARALLKEDGEKIISNEDAYLAVCNHIRRSMDKGKSNILLSHSFVVGAQLSESDRSAKVGTAMAISKSVFSGFDYVALGHIHRPQDVGEGVRYCGSPLVYSFGNEEKYEKSFTIFDTDTKKMILYPIHPLHTVRTLSGDFDEIVDMEDSDDYLRVEIKDRFTGLETTSVLKEKFPNIIELRGKSFDGEMKNSQIGINDISEMTKTDIVKTFFKELYDYEPDSEQMKMFEIAMEKIEEEGDLS